MPTGIDRQIAIEVMGWEAHEAIPNEFTLPFFYDGEITRTSSPFEWEKWSPSTDMNAAMEVVGKMRQNGFEFDLNSEPYGCSCKFWNGFLRPRNSTKESMADFGNYALAICLAALEAVKMANGRG